MTYGTTSAFLEYFGLRSLDDLPAAISRTAVDYHIFEGGVMLRPDALESRREESALIEGWRDQRKTGKQCAHRAGKLPRMELTALRRDGSTFPVEITMSTTNVGGHVAFHAFLQDITDRKAQTRRSSER